MKDKCIAAVQAAYAALGRKTPLSAAQLSAIEKRITGEAERLASTDPEWAGKTRDQRTIEAATSAMKAIQHDAALDVRRAQLQILKTADTDSRIKEQQTLHRAKSRTDGLVFDQINVDLGNQARAKIYFGRLMNLIDASRDGSGTSFGRKVSMFLFDAENPGMTVALAREIYRGADGSTGNKIAQAGAKAWLQVIEELRTRFNGAGGDIGKLDYGYAPIMHNAKAALQAGRDAWVSKVMPLIDRGRYVDQDGRALGDGEVRNILGEAWKTISSEGLNKQTPGAFNGPGSRANKGSESRVIHFKGGDEYIQYMREFGRGDMYNLMMSHVRTMTRDIGLLENYGPNPNSQMKLQFDLARLEDGSLKRVGFGLGGMRVNPEGIWKTMSGAASTPADEAVATLFQHVRNIQALKLAGTFLKMFPDLATHFSTTGYGDQGYWHAISNLGKSATKDAREFAGMHGLIADAGVRELSRFAGENIGNQWSARLSNSQMKLTLGDAWTSWLDRAAGLTKMGALGRLMDKDWGKLSQWDMIHLQRAGVTDADWAIVRKATPDTLNGIKMLTPESVIATGEPGAVQAAERILAAIKNDVDMSVIKPDLLARTAGTWNGTQAGTGLGEFARCVMQFKSFPIAMVTRHYARVLDTPKVTDGSKPLMANRALYAGALAVSLTALGAISLQATQIVTGKDPIDMFGKHAPKFWINAFSVGGAGGFYGDMLTRDTTQDRSANDFIGSLAGPTAGDIATVYQITKGNLDDKLAGKQTHTFAEAVKFARSHTPYANIWYAKAALDHAGMHSLQENLSPGYLSKMRAQASKAWDQGYWWAPGTGGPQRAPDFGKAVGQ